MATRACARRPSETVVYFGKTGQGSSASLVVILKNDKDAQLPGPCGPGIVGLASADYVEDANDAVKALSDRVDQDRKPSCVFMLSWLRIVREKAYRSHP